MAPLLRDLPDEQALIPIRSCASSDYRNLRKSRHIRLLDWPVEWPIRPPSGVGVPRVQATEWYPQGHAAKDFGRLPRRPVRHEDCSFSLRDSSWAATDKTYCPVAAVPLRGRRHDRARHAPGAWCRQLQPKAGQQNRQAAGPACPSQTTPASGAPCQACRSQATQVAAASSQERRGHLEPCGGRLSCRGQQVEDSADSADGSRSHGVVAQGWSGYPAGP